MSIEIKSLQDGEDVNQCIGEIYKNETILPESYSIKDMVVYKLFCSDYAARSVEYAERQREINNKAHDKKELYETLQPVFDNKQQLPGKCGRWALGATVASFVVGGLSYILGTKKIPDMYEQWYGYAAAALVFTMGVGKITYDVVQQRKEWNLLWDERHAYDVLCIQEEKQKKRFRVAGVIEEIIQNYEDMYISNPIAKVGFSEKIRKRNAGPENTF